LSASRAERFEALELALNRFQPPVPNWSDFEKNHLVSSDTPNSLLPETKRLHLNTTKKTEKVSDAVDQIIPLNGDPIKAAMEWHQKEKARGRRIPNSLFMGGPVEKPCLAVFTRALSPSDFVRLWTL
jgi:hypothetical protein